MNYVNNKQLYSELKQYVESVKAWQQDETAPRPHLSQHPYLVNAMIAIINGLAQKGQFRGYSYLEDMRQDALLTCILYIDRFNPDKSTNAFGYITQIARNAFLKRIAKEKRQAWWKATAFEVVERRRKAGKRYDDEAEMLAA